MEPNLDKNLLDQEELKEWNVAKYRTTKVPLVKLYHKVIFLGAVESQHNAVCWSIKIDRKDEAHHVHLEVPEGGLILDMSSWEAGFQQIYARHRYEQLYKTVLLNVHDSSVGDFAVPNNYLLRRILGLKNDIQRNGLSATNSGVLRLDYKQLKIPLDYLADNEHDRDVRRYIANHHLTKRDPMFRYIERHDKVPVMPKRLNWPLITPPLYPPIKTSENKYKYLQYDDRVYAVADISGKYQDYFKIKSDPANYYQLDTSMEVYAYPWCSGLFRVESTRQKPSANEAAVKTAHSNDHVYWQRLGMDYLTHYKWIDAANVQAAASRTDVEGFTKAKPKKGKGKGKGKDPSSGSAQKTDDQKGGQKTGDQKGGQKTGDQKGGQKTGDQKGGQKTDDQTGSQQTTTEEEAVDFCKMQSFVLTQMTAEEVKTKIKKE